MQRRGASWVNCNLTVYGGNTDPRFLGTPSPRKKGPWSSPGTRLVPKIVNRVERCQGVLSDRSCNVLFPVKVPLKSYQGVGGKLPGNPCPAEVVRLQLHRGKYGEGKTTFTGSGPKADSFVTKPHGGVWFWKRTKEGDYPCGDHFTQRGVAFVCK